MKIQLIFLMLFMAVPVAMAAVESSHQCSEKNCLEGTGINFTVEIYNNLNSPITVDDIYIKDVESSKILAIDIRKQQIIPPGVNMSFVIPSEVLAPAKGYTFYYVPCFKAQEFNDSSVMGQNTICGKTIKSLTVIPISKVECRTDLECSTDNYCNTNSLYKCRPVVCNASETIVNHKCVELSCNTFQYKSNQACVFNGYLFGGVVLVALVALGLVAALMINLKPKKRGVKNK